MVAAQARRTRTPNRVGGFPTAVIAQGTRSYFAPSFQGRGSIVATVGDNLVNADAEAIARRRRMAGGGGILYMPYLLSNFNEAPLAPVPFYPPSTNRPFAGRYPWYHGGWSGWSAWPTVWDNSAPVNYVNPYIIIIDARPQIPRRPVQFTLAPELDYSRPIQRAGEVPPRTIDSAQQLLDSARTAFRNGDYDRARTQAEQSIRQLPGDGNLHEFRALCLFAVGQHREAAAVIHAVLSADPGWSWDTLSSFYPDAQTYTQHLRRLERAVEENPNDPGRRFLLAYHYLVLEEREAAMSQLRIVLELEPKDTVASALLEALEKDRSRRGGKKSPPAIPVKAGLST